jgi:hypothetical protein
MSLDEILGYCGLYCPGCGVYQATATGGGLEYEPGSVTTCRGCNSGEVSLWCSDCEIKLCAREKGVRYCLECGDFPCEKSRGFMDDPRFPYHKDVPEMMERLSQVGLEQWAEEQSRKWVCANCGGGFDWFAESCPGCGIAVNKR